MIVVFINYILYNSLLMGGGALYSPNAVLYIVDPLCHNYSFALVSVPIVSTFFIVYKQKKKVVILFVVYPLCQNYQLCLYFKVPNRPAPE